MRKYIHAYNIPGRGTVYTEVDSWSGSEISGEPFIINNETSINGYTNITSIKNWEFFKDRIIDIKQQIKYLFDETTWENLNLEEKKIVAKLFLVEKELRDLVLTEEEQQEYNYFRLYDMISEDIYIFKNITDKKVTPKSIDYKRDINGRLHPEYIFDLRGSLIECNYYQDVDVWIDQFGFKQFDYSTPVLKYTAEYSLDSDGYVLYRIVTRRWYKLDGTLSDDDKVTIKYYEPIKSRDEVRRRRHNIINKLLVEVTGLLIITSPDLNNVTDTERDAMPFMRSISSAIAEYYEYGATRDSEGNPSRLIQEISVADYSKLDNFIPNTNNTSTIRQFIIWRLEFGEI
jgi:hypothetical protein